MPIKAPIILPQKGGKMFSIFTGEDRIRAKQEIIKILGNDYEVIDGAEISPNDLPSIFLGQSLFATKRKILIRDLFSNKPAFEKLPEYLDTPHIIIDLETKIDKRSSAYKIISKKVAVKEFALPKNPNSSLVFDIYKIAKKDGKKAVENLEKIKNTQDPIMFFGLMVSQAVGDYSKKQGNTQKKILKELAKVDMQMKTTPTDPWLLIESFLLSLSSF